MEPIARHLLNVSEQTPKPESAPTAPVSQTAIRTLWARMTEIYGHRWSATFGESTEGNSAADTWAKGLAGITPAQLADGLKACITSSDPWPPTLPEFRAMCVGVPSLVTIRAEINGKGERTPFAILVWQRLDAYQFRMVSAKDAERMLRDAYEDAREFVMRGGALPAVAPAIESEEKEFKPVSDDIAKKHMLDLRRELYGNKGNDDYIAKADSTF